MKCVACQGELQGATVEGLKIVTGVKPLGGGRFGDGEILDPKSGKTFRVEMTLQDGGEALAVRGYVGTPLLGRTQVWKREP